MNRKELMEYIDSIHMDAVAKANLKLEVLCAMSEEYKQGLERGIELMKGLWAK